MIRHKHGIADRNCKRQWVNLILSVECYGMNAYINDKIDLQMHGAELPKFILLID